MSRFSENRGKSRSSENQLDDLVRDVECFKFDIDIMCESGLVDSDKLLTFKKDLDKVGKSFQALGLLSEEDIQEYYFLSREKFNNFLKFINKISKLEKEKEEAEEDSDEV